ncbi:hypothetical protein [Flaviaesturariibacter amylovorans]|uniref:Uncharacterized protein n=1 Tax=Flaviaesturariibacter amylovorans TaxID=1084520 RepID=A0ABP8GTC7_9BACT
MHSLSKKVQRGQKDRNEARLIQTVDRRFHWIVLLAIVFVIAYQRFFGYLQIGGNTT